MIGVGGEDAAAALQDAATLLQDQGWCVVPDVLETGRTASILDRLWRAAERSRARGMPTHMPALDPNDRNVRVFNLLDLDHRRPTSAWVQTC